jgi:hypothetical protein
MELSFAECEKAVMSKNRARMWLAVVAAVCLSGYCGAFAPPMAPPSAAPASRANPLALRMVAAPQGDERMGRRAMATFSAVAVAAAFPLSGVCRPCALHAQRERVFVRMLVRTIGAGLGADRLLHAVR